MTRGRTIDLLPRMRLDRLAIARSGTAFLILFLLHGRMGST